MTLQKLGIFTSKMDNGLDLYNMKAIMEDDDSDRLLLYYYDP